MNDRTPPDKGNERPNRRVSTGRIGSAPYAIVALENGRVQFVEWVA